MARYASSPASKERWSPPRFRTTCAKPSKTHFGSDHTALTTARHTGAVGRFLLFAFALSMIERFFALHPRRFRRDRWHTDALHLLFNNILISAGLVVALVGLIVALRPAVSPELQGWVTSQPAWLQFVEAVA